MQANLGYNQKSYVYLLELSNFDDFREIVFLYEIWLVIFFIFSSFCWEKNTKRQLVHHPPFPYDHISLTFHNDCTEKSLETLALSIYNF